MRARHLAVLTLVSLAPLATHATATIEIVNVNAPGVGFNDPTPAVPVGGNAGTTLGEQRLVAFQYAASIWGSTLDSSIPVRVQASMVPLSCNAISAVLGSAGTIQIIRDFPNAPFSGTWYHTSLANKLAGVDTIPGDPNTLADDIRARFNSELGKPGCLTGSFWYLGLDFPAPAGQISLVTVLLHEFAHGLGFSSFASVSTGAYPAGFSDVYSRFYFDNTTGKARDQMTDAERTASAINPRNVIWTGGRVTTSVSSVLAAGTPVLKVTSPASISGDYAVGSAAFGPVLSSPGVSGQIVVATDASNASGPSTTDACTAITNPASVAGRIALVDRGTCGFVVKVKNAQNAGAIAVIVADNAAGGPPAGLGGADPTIVIPSVRITLPDGNKIKAALAADAVNGTVGVDLAVRAGADRQGRAMLYTPNPVQPGSSVSHWDTSAFPNQLMEPAINADLTFGVQPPNDLTLPLFRDVGWYLDRDLDLVDDEGKDQCLGSDLSATVVIGGVDTGVPNEFFTDGCTIVDRVNACAAGATNHGGYVSCASAWTNTLKGAGILTGAQKGAIQRAVAQNKNP